MINISEYNTGRKPLVPIITLPIHDKVTQSNIHNVNKNMEITNTIIGHCSSVITGTAANQGDVRSSETPVPKPIQ